jgi:hypothetical protein
VAALMEALENIPPKITLKRATVCQHIEFKKIIPIIEKIKITDVFWSHSIKDEYKISTFNILPFPLFPSGGSVL